VEAAIRVEHLDISRGGRAVVRDLSFTVPSGTLVGLLGPSGSGKTTLMRALMGTQVVAGGNVELLGYPAGSRALRGKIGYVTQAPSVYADLTVSENLRYFGQVLGVPATEAPRVISDVRLQDPGGTLVRHLSGGEQARVSLAAALLGAPPVLVLDEPTVGLDPLLRRELWRIFEDLASGGTSLLVSSHVMDEAQHCDRLLLMREGIILADVVPSDLLGRTGAPDYEAAFIELIEGAST